ncbi:MAG: alpha/beta fold hydrolase [Candidatus Eremiobacteraeota bacterium]|nr:alpha/beta fold hydrolase [Candidatus Eremiobacteraeota bacterium]
MTACRPAALSRRDFCSGSVALVAASLGGCDARTTPLPAIAIAHEPPSFAAAVAALRSIIADDKANPAVSRNGLPRLYTHGKATEHAVVLFHGFTNCPQQFDELARNYYRRGCNVIVPRIPAHGLKDRLTYALADVTAEQFQTFAAQSFWLTSGLGKRVSAVGLSLGGTLALWLAQTQPIDLAVPIAPFLVPLPFSEKAGSALARLLYAMPNFYWWWDPRIKEKSLPRYAYPGFPTHALAQMVFLGDAIFAAAGKEKPRAHDCILVTNPNDNAVTNAASYDLLATWNRWGVNYRQVLLTGLGPPRHDVIDPVTYPQGRTLVYPKLEAFVFSARD